MVYTPRFFCLQNAVCFIILTHLVPLLFTFYIQDVQNLKKINNSGAKRLIIEDGTYRLSQKASKKLQLLDTQYPRRAQLSSTSRRRPEFTRLNLVSYFFFGGGGFLPYENKRKFPFETSGRPHLARDAERHPRRHTPL